MKWPKDRKKAFLWAAEAFGTPDAERTERQKLLTKGGLCFAIGRIAHSRNATDWVFDFGEKVGLKTMYWWPTRSNPFWTPSCDKERSDFCCLMAQLSDKEFKSLNT